MKYKKGLIFICLIICLFSITSVVASDVNETVVASDNQNIDLVENQNDAISLVNNAETNIENADDMKNDKIANNNNILESSESDDELSIDNDMNVLSAKLSPPSNYYRVVVNSAQVDSGGSGTIKINVDGCYYDGYYNYDFNLRIFNSRGGSIIGQRFQGTSQINLLTYSFKATAFSPGSYAIKAINVNDGVVMSTATLTVKGSTPYPSTYPSASDYSVIVSDTNINYGSSGSISMRINPAYGSTYAYYYYLKVYDSNNNLKISNTYSNLNKDYSETYRFNSNQLSPGMYTIKIINYGDNKLMSAAKLTITNSTHNPSTYPSASDYSISVSDTNINYGSSGSIPMIISPAYGSTYAYYYYLKVYDSNNNEKISQLYSGINSVYSKTYAVSANQLSPGTYTIKIINYVDNELMCTAKLTITDSTSSPSTYTSTYPLASEYSISVDFTYNYGSCESISMSNVYSAGKSTYAYCYYLKIYDSNNNEKISKLYYSTNFGGSKKYTLPNDQLSPGNYTVKLINYYDSKVMYTNEITVKNVPTYPSYTDYSVSVNAYIGDYGSVLIIMPITPAYNSIYSHYYYLKVYDSNNDEIISQLYYDTEIYHSKYYRINPYQLSPGNYTVKIINYYDSKVMDTVNFTVNSIPTKISAYDVTTVYDGGKYLTATLEDSWGVLLCGVKLSIVLNGKTYTPTTDDWGQIKVSTNGLVPKTYTATITFGGKDYYAKSSITTKVIVKKATPKLTAKKKTFKKSVKTKKYTVTLKNNKNKALKKVKLSLKVKGKTYYATTNKYGKATFKITKLTKKGKYTATLKFKGSKYYKAKTVKPKITIK